MTMKDATKQTSAFRIKQLLSERNWKQTDLAKRLDVSPQAVQQWVKGTSSPRGKSLSKLSSVTGLPEHWFFMAEDDHTDTLQVQQPTRVLDSRQEKLLSLFDQMPESEKDHMVALFESKVQEYERLLNELIALKNKKI